MVNRSACWQHVYRHQVVMQLRHNSSTLFFSHIFLMEFVRHTHKESEGALLGGGVHVVILLHNAPNTSTWFHGPATAHNITHTRSEWNKIRSRHEIKIVWVICTFLCVILDVHSYFWYWLFLEMAKKNQVFCILLLLLILLLLKDEKKNVFVRQKCNFGNGI